MNRIHICEELDLKSYSQFHLCVELEPYLFIYLNMNHARPIGFGFKVKYESM
jgi:hypothetical protein